MCVSLCSLLVSRQFYRSFIAMRCERGMYTFARSARIQLLLMSPSTKLFCNVEFSSLRAKFRYWTIRNRWCKRTRLLITAYVHGRQSKCLFAILASAYIHSGERVRARDTERKKRVPVRAHLFLLGLSTVSVHLLSSSSSRCVLLRCCLKPQSCRCDYSIIRAQDLSNVTRLATTVSGHPSTDEERKERERHSLSPLTIVCGMVTIVASLNTSTFSIVNEESRHSM